MKPLLVQGIEMLGIGDAVMKIIMMSVLTVLVLLLWTCLGRADSVFVPQTFTAGLQNTQQASLDANYREIDRELFRQAVEDYVQDISAFEETDWTKVQHAVEVDRAMRQAI